MSNNTVTIYHYIYKGTFLFFWQDFHSCKVFLQWVLVPVVMATFSSRSVFSMFLLQWQGSMSASRRRQSLHVAALTFPRRVHDRKSPPPRSRLRAPKRELFFLHTERYPLLDPCLCCLAAYYSRSGGPSGFEMSEMTCSKWVSRLPSHHRSGQAWTCLDELLFHTHLGIEEICTVLYRSTIDVECLKIWAPWRRPTDYSAGYPQFYGWLVATLVPPAVGPLLPGAEVGGISQINLRI